MNPRRLIFIIAAISASAIIVSCASSGPAAKLIVGNWKPVKAEKYYEPGYTEQSIANMMVDTTKSKNVKAPANPKDTVRKAEPAKVVGPSAKEQKDKILAKWDHMVSTEERSGLIIKSDKTLQKVFKNKTVELTWKMKGGGKAIAVKNPENKQKFNVKIESLSDSSMVIVEKIPEFDLGGVRVYYRRSK